MVICHFPFIEFIMDISMIICILIDFNIVKTYDDGIMDMYDNIFISIILFVAKNML